MTLRQLGTSDLQVSTVSLGCWPMAGITSLVHSQSELTATIEAAREAGINFFDTAYSYGYAGQSDYLLQAALGPTLRCDRQSVVIASKVGMHWNDQRERVLDARPATLIQHAQEVLARLGVDYVDVMYLHSPDGQTPIEESAGAIAQVIQRGWARYAGVSNVDSQQAAAFHRICPVVAVQPYFNMLQQEAVRELWPWCQANQVSLVGYWVLMKGLLAGHLRRDHQFDPQDRRLSYDIFRGVSWEKNQELLDRLEVIARRVGCTISQLVIAWTLAQPQITVALCGAKRPSQVVENAQGMHWTLDQATLAEIETCIAQRGVLRG